MHLPAPLEKEPALLVIGPASDEKELTPVYQLAPEEKEPAHLVIRSAPERRS